METLALVVAEVEQTSRRQAQATTSGGSELDQIRLLSPESYAQQVDEIVLAHRADADDLERRNRDDLAKRAHKIRGGAYLTGDCELDEACLLFEQLVMRGANRCAIGSRSKWFWRVFRLLKFG